MPPPMFRGRTQTFAMQKKNLSVPRATINLQVINLNHSATEKPLSLAKRKMPTAELCSLKRQTKRQAGRAMPFKIKSTMLRRNSAKSATALTSLLKSARLSASAVRKSTSSLSLLQRIPRRQNLPLTNLNFASPHSQTELNQLPMKSNSTRLKIKTLCFQFPTFSQPLTSFVQRQKAQTMQSATELHIVTIAKSAMLSFVPRKKQKPPTEKSCLPSLSDLKNAKTICKKSLTTSTICSLSSTS